MSITRERKQVLFEYFFVLLWVVLAVILRFFPSPFSIFLIFAGLVILPGLAIARLFRISFTEDRLGNFILYLSLGLVSNIFVSLVGLFANFNIDGLVIFSLIFNGLLLLGAFVKDLYLPPKSETFEFRSFFKGENLILVALGVFTIFILAVVDQLGSNFYGDPMNHLSIIRKVVDGQPISIENISWVKDQFHPAYIFSLWHIFLGVAAKITDTNIFSFWREIPTVLSLFTIVVWYWLLLKLLPNKYVAVLGTFGFIIYEFGPNAYLFTRLAVPDTLNTLMLFPLSLALALKYVFSEKSNYKHLIVLSSVVVLTATIHMTQYFYYLLVMGLFLIFYAIFKYKDADYKKILLKIVLAGLANLALVIPMLVYIQFKGNTLTKNLAVFGSVQTVFRNDRFYKFQPYFKFAYLTLPLVWLFIRKYRRLVLLLAIFIIGPLVFNIPGLKEFLYRILSHVFVKRFYASVEWPFVIWALFLGFIFTLKLRYVEWLARWNKNSRYVIYALIALFTIWLFWFEFSTEKVGGLYDRVFGEDTRLWINERYYWLFAIVILVSVIIYIWQRYSKKATDFFNFDEKGDFLIGFFLLIITVFFFSLPGQGHLRTYVPKEFKTGRFFRPVEDPTHLVINFDKFGGQSTIDFIRQNIPAKSVFDSTDANYVLPMLADVHMASLTYDAEPTKKYEKIYDSTISSEERMKLINDGQIDYVLFLLKSCDAATPFRQDYTHFTTVYHTCNVDIYKVVK